MGEGKSCERIKEKRKKGKKKKRKKKRKEKIISDHPIVG